MKGCPGCKFCEGPPQGRAIIRNSADAQAFFRCHDSRFPRFLTRLRGLAVQLDRATR